MSATVSNETGESIAEGVSDWTANVRFLTAWQAWQAAVNVNYRSGFLEERELTNNADTYVDDFTSLDVSLNWLFSENATLRLDVYNATNQTLVRHVATDSASALMKIEEFGRRYVLSLGLMF